MIVYRHYEEFEQDLLSILDVDYGDDFQLDTFHLYLDQHPAPNDEPTL